LAFVATMSVAVRMPIANGENMIVKVQLAPGSKLGQLFPLLLSVKSGPFGPEITIDEMSSGAVAEAEFEMLKVCCELEPIIVGLNVKEGSLSSMIG